MNDQLPSRVVRLTPRAKRPFVISFHDIYDTRWFATLIDALAQTGEIISMGEFVSRKRNSALTGNELTLTFDDGYASIFDIVHPVLSEKRVPYTSYLCTEAIETGLPPWFVRLEGLYSLATPAEVARRLSNCRPQVRTWPELSALMKVLPLNTVLKCLDQAEADFGGSPAMAGIQFLTPQQVRDLSLSSTVTFGSHTHRHPILANLSPEAQEREIRYNVESIEKLTGNRPRHFAYPNGMSLDFNANTLDILKMLEFESAVTTVQRTVQKHDDLHRFPRIGVSNGDSIVRLELKLNLPWFSRAMNREENLRSTYSELIARGPHNE